MRGLHCRLIILVNLTVIVKKARHREGLSVVIQYIPAKHRRTARRVATGRIRSRGARDGSETAVLAATAEGCDGSAARICLRPTLPSNGADMARGSSERRSSRPGLRADQGMRMPPCGRACLRCWNRSCAPGATSTSAGGSSSPERRSDHRIWPVVYAVAGASQPFGVHVYDGAISTSRSRTTRLSSCRSSCKPRRGLASRLHGHGSTGFESRQPLVATQFLRQVPGRSDAGNSAPRR